MFARRKGEGKTAQRVSDLLLDELGKLYPGIGIAAEDFWFQQGAYTHMTWDLARWGAEIPIPGKPLRVQLYSFDTMTNCARGLSLRKDPKDLPHTFDVVATHDEK